MSLLERPTREQGDTSTTAVLTDVVAHRVFGSDDPWCFSYTIVHAGHTCREVDDWTARRFLRVAGYGTRSADRLLTNAEQASLAG